jgi:hypothetical protein
MKRWTLLKIATIKLLIPESLTPRSWPTILGKEHKPPTYPPQLFSVVVDEPTTAIRRSNIMSDHFDDKGNSKKGSWIIEDDCGNRQYPDKTFDYFEDAWDFLYNEFPAGEGPAHDPDNEEELDEFSVVPE